jgi:hypothetical protein
MVRAGTVLQVPEEAQPPYYARIFSAPIEPFGQVQEIYHNDLWAAIPFYREPAKVPANFNLLQFFDFSGAAVSPLTIEGFHFVDAPSDPIPKAIKYYGLGAVPIWFVPWPELQQAIADGRLTVPDLASMLPRKGSANSFVELLYPTDSAELPEISSIIINARGHLEGGTEFRFNAAVQGSQPLCCSSNDPEQFVSIEFGAGDFNQDGTVDAADYVVWRSGLGTNYSQNDYHEWQARFGQSIGSGTDKGPIPVPEPATWLLLIIATILICSRRRRGVS